MAVDSSQLNSASRDAYWQVTKAQLKSAQKRGEILSLIGLGLLGLLLWQYPGPGDNSVGWAAGIAGIALAVVALPQVFVARRKRRISASRGMTCRHCEYVPHDTEISEVSTTRECNRCRKPLG
jgi:hypothetical protein